LRRIHKVKGCRLKGEERSEQLGIEPPRLKVLEHVRLKYACPACEAGGVQTAPKPPQPIPKSYASPGLLAWLVTAKIADGLPLYRQEAIFRRLGVDLPRQTLAAWLIRAGGMAQPLINLLRDELLTRAIIIAASHHGGSSRGPVALEPAARVPWVSAHGHRH